MSGTRRTTTTAGGASSGRSLRPGRSSSSSTTTRQGRTPSSPVRPGRTSYTAMAGRSCRRRCSTMTARRMLPAMTADAIPYTRRQAWQGRPRGRIMKRAAHGGAFPGRLCAVHGYEPAGGLPRDIRQCRARSQTHTMDVETNCEKRQADGETPCWKRH